jgi:hypothetical protein
MFYTLITLSLIFISFIIFLPKFKSFTEQYSLGINFILTLVATLVGVLLAISITNYENDKKEKKDVTKLLNSAITSVEAAYNYSEEIIEYFNELPKDSPQRQDFYTKNALPYPVYLESMLMQSIVSKNLSGLTLSMLNLFIINLKRTQQYKPDVYPILLSLINEILLLEIKFQNNTITEIKLNAQLELIDSKHEAALLTNQ